MERADKQKTVESLNEKLGSLAAVFAIDYRGIKVSEETEFRRKIRETGGTYRVVKNSLTKRALEGTGLESLEAHLEGMTGLAFTETDPVALAKVIHDFAKIGFFHPVHFHRVRLVYQVEQGGKRVAQADTAAAAMADIKYALQFRD